MLVSKNCIVNHKNQVSISKILLLDLLMVPIYLIVKHLTYLRVMHTFPSRIYFIIADWVGLLCLEWV